MDISVPRSLPVLHPTGFTCFTSHGIYLFHIPRGLPVSHPTESACFTSHGVCLFHKRLNTFHSMLVHGRPTRTPRRQNTQEQLRGSIYHIMFDDDNPTTPTLGRRRDTSAFGLKEVRRHDCAGHNIAILRAP